MFGFEDKVNAERSALRIVNTVCGQPELCGLSRAAISTWEGSDKKARSRLAAVLLEIAGLISSLCERSADRFDEGELTSGDKVGKALDALRSYVSVATNAANRQ